MVGLLKKVPSAKGPREGSRWKLLSRTAGRILGKVLLALAGLILVLAAMFLLPATRGALLGWGVGLADKALPGHLEAGEVTWPSLGRLVLGDVLWVAGTRSAPGDTLVDLATLDLSLDLGALKNRDGRIDSLHLDLRLLDVPAVVAATSNLGTSSPADTDSAVTEPAGFPFLHPGSLPGIPSVSLAALDLKVGRAVLTPGVTVQEVALAGRADLERNRPARVVVDHLGTRFLTAVGDTAGAPEWEVVCEHLGLGLTLEFPVDPSGGWNLVAADLDSLNLDIAPTVNSGLREIWRTSESVNLDATGRVERNGEVYTGQLDSDFVLPGSAHFHPWLPEDFPHHEFGSVSGNLALEAYYSDPSAKGSLKLDLGSSTWVEYGVVAGEAEANLDTLRSKGLLGLTAQLDTLDVALDGIRVKAFGNYGYKDFEMGLVALLDDFRLPGLFASWVDPALRETWQDPGPVSLNLDARVRRTGQEYSGRLAGDFDLPGSSHFHPWLPENFPHEEIEAISGALDITGYYSEPVARGSLNLDLGSSPWIEEGRVAAFAETDIDSFMTSGLRHLAARLDTLNIALEGIRLDASGELGPDTMVLDLEGEVTDFRLAGLFMDPVLAEADLELIVDASVEGSLEEPQIDARFGGGFLQDGMKIPRFDFTLDGDRRNVAAFLTAGGGLEYEGVAVDSVRAEVRGEMVALDSLAANFGLALWKDENSLAMGGSVRGDSVRVVHLDSLVSVFFGQEMRTNGPASLTMGPGPDVFDLTKLEFTGPPGRVTAHGFWNDEAMDLEAGIDLLLGEAVLMEVVPSPLWSMNGGVDLKLDARAGLETTAGEPGVDGRVGVVLIPHRKEPPLGLVLDFVSRGGREALLSADFALSMADTALLEAQLVWPGKPGPEKGFWSPDPEKDLVLTVPSQKLELDRINRRLPDEVNLDGQFDIAAEIHVFPPRKGNIRPDSLAFIPFRGSIDGSLSTPKLRVDLPNRSWLNTVVDVSFAGPLEDPRVGAKIEVKSGFIRIPEIPRNLHPVEGASLLWALNDSLLAAMDSTGTDSLGTGRAFARRDSLVVFLPPDQIGPGLDQKDPVALPELDLEVVISKDLRIIGYGIDMKLGGKLEITRGFDEDNLPGPSITGDIDVPEGSLKVMNRVFKVERGHIQFTGSVPANPNLDLMLETQVNAYLLRVNVSGRAEAPVIELTSEPDLGEEDIMAVLLFGQPMNDLDTDQRGRMDEENDPSRELQKNLAGLAMAFGTRGLQDSMNESFGVDVVQMGSDSSGGSTLMVGKFITPDIVLKYHQSLEKSGTYFMTLEYSLNRYFKVVSTYGQGEEASGAELKWSRRY